MHSSYSYLVDNSCFSTALLLQTLPRPPTHFARRHLYSVLFDKNLWCVVITLFVSECDAGAIIMCSFRAASRAIPLVKARKATSSGRINCLVLCCNTSSGSGSIQPASSSTISLQSLRLRPLHHQQYTLCPSHLQLTL